MKSRRDAGFTLIEVLVTMLLMAIVLPVAMGAISLATAVSGEARRKTEAIRLAETQLADLVSTGDWQSGALEGDFGEDWPAYKWNAEISDYDVTLKEITVRVDWTARGKQREVSLTTLTYLSDEQVE